MSRGAAARPDASRARSDVQLDELRRAGREEHVALQPRCIETGLQDAKPVAAWWQLASVPGPIGTDRLDGLGRSLAERDEHELQLAVRCDGGARAQCAREAG